MPFLRYLLLTLSSVLCITYCHSQTHYGSDSLTGRFASVNGIKIYFETYGSGEPLLMLHGNSQSIVDWQQQIPEFAKHFKVIVPDSRGQGKSTDDNRELTYDLMADDMAALLDTLHINSVHLLGWSDGGNTGMAMALKYPEKLKTLITVGANYKMDTAAVGSEIIDLLETNFKSEKDLQQRKLLQLMLKYPHFTKQDLGKIKTRAIVMAGEADVILPGHTAEIAAAIPGAQMIIVKEAGHFIPYEKPDEFNNIVLGVLGVKPAENLSGNVKDSRTNDPIPYVTIYLKNTKAGTAADLSGDFEIERPAMIDTVVLSAVGYETQRIASRDVGLHHQFLLKSRDYVLKEVIIRSKPLTPESIMKEAIKNLERNYPQDSYGLEMYVNLDWKIGEGDSIIHAEGVLQGYNKTGYSRRVHAYFILMNRFYFKMIAERKQNVKDTSWVLPYSSDIMYREPIRFSNNPINKGNLPNFDFQFENTPEAQDSIFIISFKCKDPTYWNTAETYSTEYVGEIHINSRDFAIVKYKATNIADKHLLETKGKKPRYLPRNLQEQFEVEYVKTQGVYFPSVIRTYVFTYNGNERTPVSRYNSETIVYKLTLKDPEPIDAPKTYRSAAFKNAAFDAKFWRGFVVPGAIGREY